MHIGAVLHAYESHLVFRFPAPLFRNGFRGDNGIVINVVVIDGGYCQSQLLQITVAQDHLVTLPDSKIFRHTGGQEHLVLPRKGQRGFSLMKVDEIPHLIAAGKQVDFLHAVVKVYLYAALMVEHPV